MGQDMVPENPRARFLELYEALNADRGWWGDPNSLRFAAITAVTCPGRPADVAAAIRQVAAEIKEGSGWFGELNSPLRFIVSAILVLNGDDAGLFLAEVERVRALFRQVKLRRGGIYELMAILILRMGQSRAPIERKSLERFKAIYKVLKRYHWWLTGPNDFPACAILVNQTETPAVIGEGIEELYQALHDRGFSRGDPLQTAANLLYLAHLPSRDAAERYADLAQGFRAANVRIWQSDYDELAILSFLDHPAQRVVDRILECREVMARLKPKPDRSMTFSLGCGVTFLELVGRDTDMEAIVDAKALLDMQAILQAQRAACAAAAVNAAVVANAASS